MAYKPTELLTVYLDARNQRRKVGRLAFKDRQILFEYDASFLASGIEISPIKLPLRPGVSIADTAISTACSEHSMTVCRTDGAAFCSTARWKNTVSSRPTESARPAGLCATARHGRSQLRAGAGEQTADDAPLALDKLAEESAVVLAGENEEVFEDLLRLNGSSSGAHPRRSWRK